MAKRTPSKDLTRIGRRVRKQRAKTTSPLWRRKALAMWSLIVRRGGKCEICGRGNDVVRLQGHHILPRTRYQWLMFAPVNGLCACENCHKTGRHSAHQNPIWFAEWLRASKPQTYAWVLSHMNDTPRLPPDFKFAYDHLYRRAAALGIIEILS